MCDFSYSQFETYHLFSVRFNTLENYRAVAHAHRAKALDVLSNAVIFRNSVTLQLTFIKKIEEHDRERVENLIRSLKTSNDLVKQNHHIA